MNEQENNLNNEFLLKKDNYEWKGLKFTAYGFVNKFTVNGGGYIQILFNKYTDKECLNDIEQVEIKIGLDSFSEDIKKDKIKESIARGLLQLPEFEGWEVFDSNENN